jgi:hypothetical protein
VGRWQSQKYPNLTLQFNDDGTVIYNAIPGTFKFESKDRLVIETSAEVLGQTVHKMRVILREDKMTLIDKRGFSLQWRRAQPG